MQLVNYEDSHIIEVVSERVISETEIFTSSMGFEVAFGITAFDESSELIEDEEIGTMKAFYVSWGDNSAYTNDTLSLTGLTEIPLRPCTAEDFGLSETLEQLNTDMISGGNSKFYPMSNENFEYIKVYYPKMKCIDKELSIYGDYDSLNAKNLAIVFEKCDSSVRTCKSREEIENWL